MTFYMIEPIIEGTGTTTDVVDATIMTPINSKDPTINVKGP